MTAFLVDRVRETWALALAGGPWLLGGFDLAGAIHALIPVDRISHHLGRPGLTAVVKASLMGIPLPLYVCATSWTQRAAARIAGVQGPGARLVCLLVGSVTNIAAMLIVVRDVGRRGLNTYLTTIMLVSLAFRLATEFAVDAWSVLPSG